MMDGSVVYFVQAQPKGPIKIGTSEHVEQRVTQLRANTRQRLVVRLLLPGSTPLERQLHRTFAAYEIGGEWYWPTPEIEQFIANPILGELSPLQAYLLAHPEVTQDALARAAGIDPASLSRALSGKSCIGASIRSRIAMATGGEVPVESWGPMPSRWLRRKEVPAPVKRGGFVSVPAGCHSWCRKLVPVAASAVRP